MTIMFESPYFIELIDCPVLPFLAWGKMEVKGERKGENCK